MCRAYFSIAALAAALLAVALPGHADETLGYDPAADPFALVADARLAAAAEDKRILVIAGGEWCIWCHYLHRFISSNEDVESALQDTFVVVDAYFGEENENEAFFATLPEAAGYPHFWILDDDGEVLASQNTLPLEDGDKSYDRGRFLAFIDEWKRQ